MNKPLVVKKLTVSYGHSSALWDIDFAIESGQIIGVIGPNGAGKTTFAREYLPHEGGCPDFINADLIAAGLSPFDPDRVAVATPCGNAMSGGTNVPCRPTIRVPSGLR